MVLSVPSWVLALLILAPAAPAAPAAHSAPAAAASLAAVGDVMLGRGLNRSIGARGATYPFARVRDILRQADLTLANLECVLGQGGQPRAKRFVLRAHPSAAAALTDAGFGLLDLANNHSLDFGDAALSETLGILSSLGVPVVGAGRTFDDAYRPIFIEKSGIVFAFVAYSLSAADSLSLPEGTVALATMREVARGIDVAHRAADYTVALFHWGFEDEHLPTERQVTYAHVAIDAGAQLVIGSHPHVLQPLEAYHDGIIAYSLGNFVFDSAELDRRQTVILRVTVRRNSTADVELVPILIVDGQPQPADPVQAQGIADLLQRLSLSRGIRMHMQHDGVLHAQVIANGRAIGADTKQAAR